MTRADVDHAWLIFGSALVLFMHAGFTLLEVSSFLVSHTRKSKFNIGS
jgi:ammonia channel protein AmtB